MTPLSEKAKEEINDWIKHLTPIHGEYEMHFYEQGAKRGYHTAYTELQAELTRLKKEVDRLAKENEKYRVANIRNNQY
jgi:carbonic anhydrase